jgi:5-methyltetrahydropteroyltriglutamate--homocysteine methyltransferase
VGSLLRPPELLAARQQHDAGQLPTDRLREIEDQAVLDALAMQREVGIGVVTDGEARRGTWLALWWEGLEGIVEVDEPPMRIEWHDIPDDSISQDELQLRPVAVTGKLSRRLPLTETEAAFLLAHADGRFKITMPSPTMTSTLWLAGHSEKAYPAVADMLADVVALQIAEIDALADLGVNWIQIDSLRYLSFLDPTLRARIAKLGLDLDAALAQTVALDNQVIAAAHRRGMTVGLHLCRGNNRSAWMATGSYEAVAEQLFGQVRADRLLLEYDTERAGGFEPLRHVPAGTMVVLGLVSSKTPVLESGDDLRRRIDEAARYVDPDHLAISPQCGFASTMQGNALTPDDQRRKLELVVSTAAEVWT